MAYEKLLLLNDAGVMDTFTAKAIGTISGGQFVTVQSGTNALSSGATNAGGYNWDDVLVDVTSSSGNTVAPLGIAIQAVTSGYSVAFLRKGDVILEASGGISVGDSVVSTQSGTNIGQVATLTNFIGSAASTYDGIHRKIGKAYTAAADGTMVLVRLDL